MHRGETGDTLMPNLLPPNLFFALYNPPIYAILSRYKITPMPGYLVTPAGSLVFGERNNIKEETP